MKLPLKLTICGKVYKIIRKDLGGGEFCLGDQRIVIGTRWSDEVQFETFIHEIMEVILAEKDFRYSREVDQRTNGDYLFSFNHKEFENAMDEFSYVLRQVYGFKIKK